ncbi:MAG: carbon storage regulator [Planctomycetota bacterium]|nr:MAG: carbon storage regulator [Planctomycetota bacterium]REJ92183.1 MAG: carbon storage regulator [Planctomycetota bacterium]REK28710.1 MAG: carbon storage regulator [Planctomycetota bacterium]REK39500.1 MAG: carbon storage regulator [Planctomycetota bacterium]
MLVLGRRTGEQIVIGDDVELVVVSVRGDRVKLGFRAPQDVAIHREEVYKRAREEQDSIQANPTSPAKRPVSTAVA